jgi:ATP-binding cassette subfamily C protein
MADWQLLNSRSKTNHLQVLTREVPNLANYYYYYLRLLTTVLMAGAYTVYAMLISPWFTLVIIGVGMILFLVLRRFLRKSFRLGQGYVDSYYRLLKYIDDFWQTVKIAKVHSSELIQRITGLLVLVGVVWFGYTWGSVPIASFVILILLFSRIFPQMTAMNTDLNMIATNVPSVRLVMQLDEDLPEPAVQDRQGFSALRLREGIILEGISFAYPDGEKLFEGFRAQIRARSITGIVGPSGKGKTTLIDLIAGLQKPSSGRILIDGVMLDDDLLPRWKAGLGYLPQDPFFIDGTLRENLVWDSGDGISDEEVMKVLEQVNAVHLVKRFRKGLDAFVVNWHTSFSGGECQRLALARVLLRKPSVLLLDEATSSLDAENEVTVMEVLARLKEKVTIVFVTHRESVTRWFDEVIKI